MTGLTNKENKELHNTQKEFERVVLSAIADINAQMCHIINLLEGGKEKHGN